VRPRDVRSRLRERCRDADLILQRLELPLVEESFSRHLVEARDLDAALLLGALEERHHLAAIEQGFKGHVEPSDDRREASSGQSRRNDRPGNRGFPEGRGAKLLRALFA
jgi:hypothetical protein